MDATATVASVDGSANDGGGSRRYLDVLTKRVESLLSWADKQGCTLVDDGRAMETVVHIGGLHVLQCGMQTRDWVLPDKTCDWAAMAGDLAVLEWGQERGCPWSGTNSLAAALEAIWK